MSDDARTVSPKSVTLEPWQVAVAALASVSRPPDAPSALARKIGGRQQVLPLSIVELSHLQRALRLYASLLERVEMCIASESDAMAEDLKS